MARRVRKGGIDVAAGDKLPPYRAPGLAQKRKVRRREGVRLTVRIAGCMFRLAARYFTKYQGGARFATVTPRVSDKGTAYSHQKKQRRQRSALGGRRLRLHG